MILLDEPTASLDPRTKWVLVNMIVQLGRQGKTVITATHELEIVPVIAQARLLSSAKTGLILADGAADEVLHDEALLIRANLIHEHLHQHAPVTHAHGHEPGVHHGEEALEHSA